MKVKSRYVLLITLKPLALGSMRQGDAERHTAVTRKVHTLSREERRFLYFNHLSKEFLEQMIPHLKALI